MKNKKKLNWNINKLCKYCFKNREENMKQRKNTIDQKNIYNQKQGNFLKIIEKKFKI